MFIKRSYEPLKMQIDRAYKYQRAPSQYSISSNSPPAAVANHPVSLHPHRVFVCSVFVHSRGEELKVTVQMK